MFIQNYTQLPCEFYSICQPEPLKNARLISINQTLVNQLQLSTDSNEMLGWLTGETLNPNMTPIAQKYTGHQFGYYNPNLGDGRGLLLGQWQDTQGSYWDFHLKGAGRTPYSRRGDGRAVLRSTIREFLASEALYGLGVPTTRALALAISSDQVRREIMEPRATLIRVTSTHIRFGHFEWAASQGEQTFQKLLNFVLENHYSDFLSAENPAFELLNEICRRTAKLIAKWQAVGFNHGVMNTDNFSILGETFDFGPFGFMDDFTIGYVCNHSDTEARYAYNQQPKMGLWNCQVLAGTFQHILTEAQLDEALDKYIETYNQSYIDEMRAKLGLSDLQNKPNQDKEDKELIADLLVLMDAQSVDFSLFFRRLSVWKTHEESEIMALIPNPKTFQNWFERFEKRLTKETVPFVDWQAKIRANNPSIVLRNYIAQEIIEAVEKGKDEVLNQWLDVLHHPFEEHKVLKNYQQPPEHAVKNMILSCSS